MAASYPHIDLPGYSISRASRPKPAMCATGILTAASAVSPPFLAPRFPMVCRIAHTARECDPRSELSSTWALQPKSWKCCRLQQSSTGVEARFARRSSIERVGSRWAAPEELTELAGTGGSAEVVALTL